jgi:hypothetical protein
MSKRSARASPLRFSTSYGEHAHLTLRMSSKRFARLGNGFSNRLETIFPLSRAVALHNVRRAHEALWTTPAIALGICTGCVAKPISRSCFPTSKAMRGYLRSRGVGDDAPRRYRQSGDVPPMDRPQPARAWEVMGGVLSITPFARARARARVRIIWRSTSHDLPNETLGGFRGARLKLTVVRRNRAGQGCWGREGRVRNHGPHRPPLCSLFCRRQHSRECARHVGSCASHLQN